MHTFVSKLEDLNPGLQTLTAGKTIYVSIPIALLRIPTGYYISVGDVYEEDCLASEDTDNIKFRGHIQYDPSLNCKK